MKAKAFRNQIMLTVVGGRNNIADAGEDNYYFRHDWAPAQIRINSSSPTPRWMARRADTNAVVAINPADNGRSATISRPPSPATIEVMDTSPGERSMVSIYFVSATVRVRCS